MPRPTEATPRFTVLVPTYNQAHFLTAALMSLQAQRHADWEAVVVDDGSTDGTWKVLADMAQQDARIRPFKQANQGVGAALNAALREARGEWICWLSSDDLFLAETLEVFAGAIAAEPQVRFFHADFLELLHPAGTLRPGPPDRAKALPKAELQTIQFFTGNYIHGISICVQRSLFDEVGAFKSELRWAQDMDMWLRMSARTPFRFIDRRICITRVHVGQGTHGFPEAGLFDSARACLDFLNRNPFEALFPNLDLTDGEGITEALQASLATALNLNACMYAGIGFSASLLERLGEWLGRGCPAAYRDSIVAGLQGLEPQLADAPAPLRDAIGAMAHRRPIRYESRDPLGLMRATWRQAEAAGDPRGAALLARYLGLGTEAPRVEAPESPAEAFLLKPDFQSDDWAGHLLAYLETFRAGEPVALLLQLDPEAADAPGADEVGSAVVELARQLGLETFPDVALVARPEQLLENLRPYARIHRLPLAAGGPESPVRRRLAERLKVQV